MLDLLPVVKVEPAEISALAPGANILYAAEFREQHTVAPVDSGATGAAPFDLADYYRCPQAYRSQFERYIPYLTAIINCVYWDARYPRLVTKAYLRQLYSAGQPRLRVIGDISCDIGGSIECTVRSTEPDNPVYLYNPAATSEADETTDGYAGYGPVIMAVDILPSELPRDASAHFGRALAPFIPGHHRGRLRGPVRAVGAAGGNQAGRDPPPRRPDTRLPIPLGVLEVARTSSSRQFGTRRMVHMKKILVLGAGMVAGAHVRYLLAQPDFHVTVASRTLSKAQDIVGAQSLGPHPRGRAVQLNSDDEAAMEALIREADLAVSLLPYAYHPTVARLCVRHRVHMVTTSYVKDAMAQLDGAARAAGVILLNELGVDPGIDHMTAMRVIHRVQRQGGRIVSFTSWCGGLPAPEANTNPFGYKFSWSPRGVLLAGKNTAHYLQDGQDVVIPGEELFDHYVTVPVEVEGRLTAFEGYPNRDSLPYIGTYGIAGVKTMFRGTLRNTGWCATLRKIAELGLLDERPRDDVAGLTFARFTTKLIDPRKGMFQSTGDLKADMAAALRLPADSQVMTSLEWLGLLSDDLLPAGARAPIDILTARMLEKMPYAKGERDMLILRHEFVAEYPDIPTSTSRSGDRLTASGDRPSGHRTERAISTLVDFGIPGGDTSMSRTVGLPPAIAVKLILTGRITLTGVQVPVVPEIYEPVLAELEAMGIHFAETWEPA